MNVQDMAPTSKVTAGGAASLGMTALIYVLNAYVPLFRATPIDATLATMLVALAGIAASYLTRPSKGDVAITKVVNNGE
jgi:hypothetical protein